MAEPARRRRSLLARRPSTREHVALGARMVPFAGYDMPVQYPDRHPHRAQLDARERRPVRRLAYGPGVPVGPRPRDDGRALEALVPGRHRRPQAGPAALLAASQRGRRHLDDLMVTRPGDPGEDGRLFLVVNAARKDVDYAHHRRPGCRPASSCCRAGGPRAARPAGPGGRGGRWRSSLRKRRPWRS